jgi:hypothetical protein
MGRILLFTISVVTSWAAFAFAQYPSRFTVEEALREKGTIWEWLLLFLILYVSGLISLFVACIIKFRKHRLLPGYCLICLRMAKDHCKFLSAYAFGHFLVGILLLLIPSGIIVAIVNGVFFNFQSESLLIVWIIIVIAFTFIGSLSLAVRESLRDVKAEDYFKST